MKEENEERDKLDNPTLDGFRSFLRNCSHEISFADPKYSPAMFNGVPGKEEEKKWKESERISRESRFPPRDKHRSKESSYTPSS